MVKSVSILGSTGSIGRQTIHVCRHLGIHVCALSAHRDIARLEAQARELLPELVCVTDPEAGAELRTALADTSVRVAVGPESLLEAAVLPEADCVVTAVSGSVGLRPTMAAIGAHKRIGLANKETLVCAGTLVMRYARECGTEIIPVDSEHSAIFQSLGGVLHRDDVRSILLTASGGPFRGLTLAEMYHKTPAEALRHPNWTMGAKITVDSATLMNKGLEFIEAMHLFGVTPDQITVLVHPQSVVHSAVEYTDGAVIAQLGAPDMELPIQYALTYPDRCPSPAPALDLFAAADLQFMRPDPDAFPCLRLAMDCARAGGSDACVLSAANESAVAAFLAGRIPFGAIYETVAATLSAMPRYADPTLSEVLALDAEARSYAAALTAAKHI